MSAARLFCLPYSGASASVYARWERQLPRTIEVRPVELPGRGARMDEAPSTDPHALAAHLADEIADAIVGPYALFGHSLGALLAFEVAHVLRARGVPAPLVLFASGAEAPAVRDDADLRRPRSDAELVADLAAYGGTPHEALENPELMALVLPVLRADFLMCGAYAYDARRPALGCLVQGLGGLRDDIARADLEAWGRETAGPFDLAMFEGDHFFIHAQQERVLDLIGARIGALMPAAPALRDRLREAS